MDAISAAHQTLPLPSYVEVTALDTGRTILVRVNDRGPFVARPASSICRAARRALLGIDRSGVARVRVRRVEPPERDRLRCAGAGRIGASRASMAQLAALARDDRARSARRSRVPAIVQVAAFADRPRAE